MDTNKTLLLIIIVIISLVIFSNCTCDECDQKEDFYGGLYYYPPIYSGCIENTFGNINCYSPPHF